MGAMERMGLSVKSSIAESVKKPDVPAAASRGKGKASDAAP